MKQEIFQIDAFTNQPFAGNPAGVTLLSQPADPKWMQNVAREMNLSETAFLVKQADGFDLRWFTPAAEVDLCGHATLASAHFLWENGILKAGDQARFHTRSGLLTAEKRGEWIEMNFPAKLETQVEPPPGLPATLGVPLSYVGRNEFDYLVEVEDETTVRGLTPDISQLARLPVRGIIVTSRGDTSRPDQRFDFVSRFFAPAVGVPEDPVTGSAHSCLAPYWGKKLGKKEMLAYQASARGGILRLRLEGERVIIAGQAVTVLQAMMTC
jgi:predicted PhzF superfamily epimerase YddE/YHI9